MQAITNEFAAKTSVRTLDKYRHHMRHICRVFSCSLMKPPDGSSFQAESDPEYIATGSGTEGASLARNFSNDENTSRELELDIMAVLTTCESENIMRYVEKNNAFVHIEATQSAASYLTSVYGQEAVSKAFCQKADGLYISGFIIKEFFQMELKSSPNFLHNLGFLPSNAVVEVDVRSASVAIFMTFKEIAEEPGTEEAGIANGTEMSAPSGDVETQAQVNTNASLKVRALVKQLKERCEEFEACIGDRLAHLDAVQSQFMALRGQEGPLSLPSQVEKALEWATMCIDIADFIFDTRRATFCRAMEELTGCNLQAMEDGNRDKIKQKMQTYIEKLLPADGEVSGTAVRQTLSDIELVDIASGRLTYGLGELAKQQSTYGKFMTAIDQTPQLDQISPDLLPLGRTIKNISMDIVPCCKLAFWPSVSAEWRNRSRVWPEQAIIEEIANKGTHLVAKAFCHVDIDWRLSFSVPEIELATRWTPAQHFVYFMFKSLFYKYIKPLSDDHTAAEATPAVSTKKYVASYTAKTVMMWTSESFEQSWWTKDNSPECLTVLLLALQSAFECRTLAHYFVASVNLLDGVPDILANRVIEIVQSILTDPVSIAGQLGSHFQRAKVFIDAMSVQASELDQLSSYLRHIGYSE